MGIRGAEAVVMTDLGVYVGHVRHEVTNERVDGFGALNSGCHVRAEDGDSPPLYRRRVQ